MPRLTKNENKVLSYWGYPKGQYVRLWEESELIAKMSQSFYPASIHISETAAAIERLVERGLVRRIQFGKLGLTQEGMEAARGIANRGAKNLRRR